MKKLGEQFQTADWKKEKHVPLIDCPDMAKSGEVFKIDISVGREISHPNTTEHHIRWIQVFFQAEGEKFTYQLANCEFTAHGESSEGADKGPIYTHHSATVNAILKKSGTIHALSFCNIHGLWENTKKISVS
jgi:superoxide reductase